jgi:hypothetical protein
MNPSFDKMLLQFLDAAFVKDFLENQLGLTDIFNLTYAASDVELKELAYTKLIRREFQVPAFETIRTSGTQERQSPTPERVRVDQEQRRFGRLAWIEVMLEVLLTAKVYDKGAPLEKVLTKNLIDDLGGINTPAELRTKLSARYPPSIVDAFFSELSITTVEEFKQRGNTALQFFYKTPPAYNPADPRNVRTYALNVCVLLQADLAVADALQRAKLCRSILENERNFADSYDGGEISAPYAFVVSFPNSRISNEAIPGMKATDIKAGLKSLFAGEGMLAHFFPDRWADK